jgi:hypothetical protein
MASRLLNAGTEVGESKDFLEAQLVVFSNFKNLVAPTTFERAATSNSTP